MSGSSKLLEDIITKQNRMTNLQIVFVDVEKYSKRRSSTQIGVVDSFTAVLRAALLKTAKHFTSYSQDNGVNFAQDIITLPTGDGAAVVFPFEGLYDAHLQFAQNVLECVYEANAANTCPKFTEHGWCNCHNTFYVRIGISEGKGIIYKDVNSGYNVAGVVMNLAARVMALADRSQILFSEDAYRQIVDMVDDPNLVDRFKEYANVKIKHDLKIAAYHYVGQGEPYINGLPPVGLDVLTRFGHIMDSIPAFGALNAPDDRDPTKILELLETLTGLLAGGGSSTQTTMLSRTVGDSSRS